MRPTRDTVPLRRCRIGIAGLTGVLIMACASTQLDAHGQTLHAPPDHCVVPACWSPARPTRW
jgi:hypothetical protein